MPPLVEIVVYGTAVPYTPFLLPCRAPFIRHRRRSRSMPLPVNRCVKNSNPFDRKKQSRPIGLLCFLAEKERFELSRRLIPTYTLSRGASSANLSTSPYGKPPFFKLAYLLYPILYYLSISFINFFTEPNFPPSLCSKSRTVFWRSLFSHGENHPFYISMRTRG